MIYRIDMHCRYFPPKKDQIMVSACSVYNSIVNKNVNYFRLGTASNIQIGARGKVTGKPIPVTFVASDNVNGGG